MKTLKGILVIVLLLSFVYCDDQITETKLIKWLRTMGGRRAEFQQKADVIQTSKLKLPTGKACIHDSDCPANYMCLDMVAITKDYLINVNAFEQFEIITQKSNIEGKECWRDPTDALESISASEILKQIIASKARLRKICVYLEEHYIRLEVPTALLNEFTDNTVIKSKIPSIRSSQLGLSFLEKTSIST